MEYPKFKVCVRCFTFNHSKYITDTMNGFVMQQTDFPYVCCIVDDASTDSEQEVIRKYVSDNFDLSEGSCHFERETDYAFITYAQHKSNKNCYFAVLYLKENHYSIKKPKMPYLAEWQDGCEYHALCEGDDYWIRPGKLQMQVEFLDNHMDYTMCFHKAKVIVESGKYSHSERCVFDSLEEREYFGKEFIGNWFIPTASMVFRATVSPPTDNRFYVGDVKLSLQCASDGRVYCLGKCMSVYRRTDNCATIVNRSVDFVKVFEQDLAYIAHFPKFKCRLVYKLMLRMGLNLISANFIRVIQAVKSCPKLMPYMCVGVFLAVPYRMCLLIKSVVNRILDFLH